MKGVVGPGDLRINVTQERKGQIKLFPELAVDFRRVIGRRDKLDAQAAKLEVGLTQLRQIESSGRSPVAAIEMQDDRAAPGEPSQRDIVALFVFHLELGRRFAEQRRPTRQLGWATEKCAYSTHVILRLHGHGTSPPAGRRALLFVLWRVFRQGLVDFALYRGG